MGHRLTGSLPLGLFLAVWVFGSLAIGQGYTPHGTCASHNWNAGYGSQTTSSDCSRPAFSDLSGYVSLSEVTNSLTSNITLTTQSTVFDGPGVAQGSTGTWWFAGYVMLASIAGGPDNVQCKLWDGTTVIDSGSAFLSNGQRFKLGFAGYLASPAGNVKISCRDATAGGNVLMVNNDTGFAKDSTLSAVRID